MPIQTDLSVSPYFDDYSENKDFYKILFRPGVAVQARELNQLQTLLQKQIERFGDNVFKRGTIVDGCDITFHDVFPYVKIKDVETDGAPVNVSQYIGYSVRNQANLTPLVAAITTVVEGFESRNPDLNTLYIRYQNSGFSNVGGVSTEESVFSANQVLTVYDSRNIIEKVTSYNDSSGFSNTDSVIVTSAIAIQNSTGGTTFSPNFYVGNYIVNGAGANAQIVEINTSANSEVVILRVKPRASDLKQANADLWTFEVNNSIQTTNTTPSQVAKIVNFVGSGAAASLKTGALGEVDYVAVTSKGSGYYVLPTVTVASPGATEGQITTANLVAQNYLTNITVANSSVSPIGSGYAMSVGAGVIYQKGYFSRVNEHLVVVEKYNTSGNLLPDMKSVGFDTTEQVINSNQDQTLLDNATGSPNETAPGANRLKLTPTLVVLDKAAADANSEFFSIAEFSQGQPYKQNRQTVYNILGNEMARRTYEESGNYVIDQFILNTKSPNAINDEQTDFSVRIDPGLAYINGKRVETVRNFEILVDKGIDTVVANNGIISLNYGNYIRINQVGGLFTFKYGDTVDLYNTPKTYVNSTPGATPAATGTKLGTARMRSFVLESGVPGTAEAVYRLYLFDVRLATARNFKLIRSVFYNGATYKGIGDVVLENGDAVLKDNNLTTLIYSAGSPAVKTSNNLSYVYRTSNTQKLATNGVITFSVTGGETFPYTGTLSGTQEKELVIVPVANASAAANLTGNVTCTTGGTNVTGAGTLFTTEVFAGDFLMLNGSVVVQVNNIVNNTSLYVKSNPSGAVTGAKGKLHFPQFIPVSLERSTRTANVSASSNTFYINLGTTISAETDVDVTFNVKSSNTTPVDKTPNRNRFVRIRTANNAATTTGPWALGVTDAFRLGKVLIGPNATFTDTDTTNVTDVTQYFYVDHNQTEDYYGTSYLFKKPNVNVAISNTQYMLVQFDYFEHSETGGLKAPGLSGTYDISDGITYDQAVATGKINTLEIPEVWGTKGTYYDLRDQFDFRPTSAATVTPTTTAATAPLNPTEPTDAARFSATDKKFPAPDSSLTGTIEYYQGRTDRVVIDENGEFIVIKGTPGNYNPPLEPDSALTINLLNIPPYPSIPFQLSANTVKFVDTKVANEKYQGQRLSAFRIQTPVDANQRATLQPKGYTMVDINKLEKRISDLEYYTSFTLVETMTQKKVIPSSANNTVDRFKFGFFVDGFNNYQYSDTTNPGYRASIVDGFLSPLVDEVNIQAQPPKDSMTLPYVEYRMIAQSQATDGPVYIPPKEPETPVNSYNGTITVIPEANAVSNTSNTVVQTTAIIQQANKTSARTDSYPYVYEEFYYTMSTITGPVEFYLNSRDNNVAVAVYQSSTQDSFSDTPMLTSASAQPITSSDIVLKSLYLNGGRAIEHPGSLERKNYGPVGGFIEDQLKLLWTHRPENGRYYKIRVYKGKRHGGLFGGQGAKGTFEYKMFYPVDSSVNQKYTINGFSPTVLYTFGYRGILTFSGLTMCGSLYYWPWIGFGSWYLPVAFSTQTVTTNYTAADQDVDITVSGLKPNTNHTMYIENVNVTSRVKQNNRLLGQGLISDANGNITAKIYYGPEIVPTTEVEKAAALALQVAGTKSVKIASSDNSSIAENTIQIPEYVKQENNTTTTTTTKVIPYTYTNLGVLGGVGGIGIDRGAFLNNIRAV